MTAIIEHNKYNSSHIYKIQSSLTDKIYIGSTCQALSQRMGGHNRHYSKYLRDNKLYITSYEIIKLGDAYITLIEKCNYNNKQQLNKREGEIIKDNINICVNKCIAGRNMKEWIQDNKQLIQVKKKQYKQDNKESIAEHSKQHYEINKQSILEQRKQYYETNKQSVLERQKQYNETNKQVIRERIKQTYTCECGKLLTIRKKTRHIITTKHLQLINKLYLDELTYYIL